MTAEVTNPAETPKRAPTLYFIVGFKFLKGIGAFLLAMEVFHLRDRNLQELFDNLVEFLHMDPDNKFVTGLADRVAEITPSNLHWFVILSVLYSIMVMIQGFGLAFRVKWIVWFVIGESAFLLPIELLEEIRHPTWVKMAVIGVNILIVWYLYSNRERLIRHHHHHHHEILPTRSDAVSPPAPKPGQPKAN